MRIARTPLALAAAGLSVCLSACLSACGAAPSLVEVELRLALLDFDADTLLEVYALDGTSVTCAALESGEATPTSEGVVRRGERLMPASRINEGASAQVEFEELPAEVPLVFHARAMDGQTRLAAACQEDVVIPNGGHVDLTLQIAE